ncbi:MAG: site-specific integrase [Shewanellaceae bacterium]|nr:site-specific integrase [Shewanellaceae bacterium]
MSTIVKRVGKRGTTYRAEIKKRKISKTFKTKKEAQLFLARLTADSSLLNSITNTTLKKLPFNQAVEDYQIQDTSKDPSKNGRFKHWVAVFSDTPVGEVTRLQIKHELTRLSTTFKPATLNRYKAAIAALYTYLSHEYDIDYNPVKGIAHYPENNARTRFLSELECRHLFNSAKKSKWERLYLLVLIAMTTGARRSEVLTLQWQNIDFRQRTAHLHITKNGQPRVLTLTTDCIREMMVYRQAGGYIFPNPSTPTTYFKNFDAHWFKALKDAGIRNFRFHDLRHTCASILAMNGASLIQIADILGHKSITMTQRYSHLCTQHKTQLTDRVFSGIDAKRQG